MTDKSMEDLEMDCAMEMIDVAQKYPLEVAISALGNLMTSIIDVIALKAEEEKFKRIRSN